MSQKQQQTYIHSSPQRTKHMKRNKKSKAYLYVWIYVKVQLTMPFVHNSICLFVYLFAVFWSCLCRAPVSLPSAYLSFNYTLSNRVNEKPIEREWNKSILLYYNVSYRYINGDKSWIEGTYRIGNGNCEIKITYNVKCIRRFCICVFVCAWMC